MQPGCHVMSHDWTEVRYPHSRLVSVGCRDNGLDLASLAGLDRRPCEATNKRLSIHTILSDCEWPRVLLPPHFNNYDIPPDPNGGHYPTPRFLSGIGEAGRSFDNNMLGCDCVDAADSLSRPRQIIVRNKHHDSKTD